MTDCNCKPFNSNFAFQHDDRRIVTCKDAGRPSVYRYKNQSSHHLAKYAVDGGLITEGAKCDFLLLNCEQKHAYFIELKGADLDHAVEQIDKSIDVLKNKLLNFTCFARIVLTRTNTIGLKSIKVRKLEEKVKRLGGTLQTKTKLLEETN